jgi:hypothetical protein
MPARPPAGPELGTTADRALHLSAKTGHFGALQINQQGIAVVFPQNKYGLPAIRGNGYGMARFVQ